MHRQKKDKKHFFTSSLKEKLKNYCQKLGENWSKTAYLFWTFEATLRQLQFSPWNSKLWEIQFVLEIKSSKMTIDEFQLQRKTKMKLDANFYIKRLHANLKFISLNLKKNMKNKSSWNVDSSSISTKFPPIFWIRASIWILTQVSWFWAPQNFSLVYIKANHFYSKPNSFENRRSFSEII